jgi:hypothetical protein
MGRSFDLNSEKEGALGRKPPKPPESEQTTKSEPLPSPSINKISIAIADDATATINDDGA